MFRLGQLKSNVRPTKEKIQARAITITGEKTGYKVPVDLQLYPSQTYKFTVPRKREENVKKCTFIVAELLNPDKVPSVPAGHTFEWADKAKATAMVNYDEFTIRLQEIEEAILKNKQHEYAK